MIPPQVGEVPLDRELPARRPQAVQAKRQGVEERAGVQGLEEIEGQVQPPDRSDALA